MKAADVFSDIFNAGINMLRPPIGSFNELVFEVSSDLVRTYKDFERETKARYAKHELVNRTTVIEYLGREPDEITFTMTFHVSLGVKPAEEISMLRRLCQDHIADYLILGNAVVGDNLWVIESVSEETTAVDHFGLVLVATAKVKMVEYVEAVNVL